MRITIKDFSDKYGIDYKTVFRASRSIEKKDDPYTHYKYNEKELIKAVANDLIGRRERAKKRVIQSNEELRLLKHGLQMQKL